MIPKRITLLGATGSIGGSVLDVAESRPDLFEIVALSAHVREDALLQAARRASPDAKLCLSGGEPVSDRIGYSGASGLARLIREIPSDIVLNGISGAAGLLSSLDAIDAGKSLALANKETMVLAGRLVLEQAARRGVKILPVDSEHAAIFQMTERFGIENIEELILTASGGVFRDRPLNDLPNVSPEEAATHPNWSMGRKITIDSSSMANKGLEVIEAVRFFGVEPDSVRVLIHPQSQVHSLIRTRDGALYAQLSDTDMRQAIQAALTWPRTDTCAFGRLDLAGKTYSFQEPDPLRYPLLGLAYAAVKAGEGYTIAYNAADEIAVDLFIGGFIGFSDIARVVESTLDGNWPSRVDDMDHVQFVDSEARKSAANKAKGL